MMKRAQAGFTSGAFREFLFRMGSSLQMNLLRAVTALSTSAPKEAGATHPGPLIGYRPVERKAGDVVTASPYINPEQSARQQIDVQLAAAGWLVQDYRQFNPVTGRGIAVREAPLKSDTCDYLLIVDRKAVGELNSRWGASSLRCWWPASSSVRGAFGPRKNVAKGSWKSNAATRPGGSMQQTGPFWRTRGAG